MTALYILYINYMLGISAIQYDLDHLRQIYPSASVDMNTCRQQIEQFEKTKPSSATELAYREGCLLYDMGQTPFFSTTKAKLVQERQKVNGKSH